MQHKYNLHLVHHRMISLNQDPIEAFYPKDPTRNAQGD